MSRLWFRIVVVLTLFEIYSLFQFILITAINSSKLAAFCGGNCLSLQYASWMSSPPDWWFWDSYNSFKWYGAETDDSFETTTTFGLTSRCFDVAILRENDHSPPVLLAAGRWSSLVLIQMPILVVSNKWYSAYYVWPANLVFPCTMSDTILGAMCTSTRRRTAQTCLSSIVLDSYVIIACCALFSSELELLI